MTPHNSAQPGDYAEAYVTGKQQSGAAFSEDEVQNMRRMLGIDRPWYEQYLTWLGGIVLRGDFGYSFEWRRPVTEVIGERLPALLTDPDGRRYDMSIPPGRMAKGPIDEMRAAAAALVAPCFLEVVGLVEHPFIQAIYDLESPGVRPGRPDRRCRIPRPASCGHGRDQGRPGCADAGGCARRSRPRRSPGGMGAQAVALRTGADRTRPLARRLP